MENIGDIMLFGHLGVGFAIKRATPRVNVCVLLILSMWLDVIYSVIGIIGISKPISLLISHGLSFSIIWSIIIFFTSYLYYKDLKTSIFLGFLVFSHWILDLISWSSNTELSLFFTIQPSIPCLGLSDIDILGECFIEGIVEFSMLIIGMLIYIQVEKKKNPISQRELSNDKLMIIKKRMLLWWIFLALFLIWSFIMEIIKRTLDKYTFESISTIIYLGIIITLFSSIKTSIYYNKLNTIGK